MKFLKSISLFFCMMACLGGGICLGAWGQRTFYPGKDYNVKHPAEYQQIAKEKISAESKNIAGSEQAADKVISAAAIPDRITADTIYLIREFNLDQNTSRDSVCQIPISYIGMNREQFLREMDSFMISPPLAELEKGFVSLEISEFSGSRVIVSKYYQNHKEDVFFLHVENNFVVVFCEDGRTRYEITDIYLPYLPEDLQQEIITGKRIEGKEVLYNFLESYSS